MILMIRPHHMLYRLPPTVAAELHAEAALTAPRAYLRCSRTKLSRGGLTYPSDAHPLCGPLDRTLRGVLSLCGGRACMNVPSPGRAAR